MMKRITKYQLDLAMAKYPTPKFTRWYLTKFPKKTFVRLELGVFMAGFVSTAFKAPKKVRGILTLAFIVLLLPVACIHVIAWIKMRICEKKRAKFLGVSLQEYWTIVN